MSDLKVKVVTPWRSDGGLRMALWDFCRNWWESRGVSPIESPSPDGPFNRSAAINQGLAGTWDVAVIIDADVIGPDLEPGIELALETRRLVFPFGRYIGLAPWGTRKVLEGGDIETAGALRVVNDHESSVVIIPWSVWIETEGFDERLRGWGQDDVVYCQAARVLTGEPLRTPGTVYHLHHEVAPEKWPGDPLWEANQALGRRYRAASSPWEIGQLIWERTHPTEPPSSLPSTSGTHGTESQA